MKKEKSLDGTEKDVFCAEFSNGTINQLKEIADYLEGDVFPMPKNDVERMEEVVRIGIGFLDRIKENKKGGS